MPRVIRRAPLLERIKAYLNPWDFLLWLSEELNSNGWDNLQKEVAIPLGIGTNIIFMVAQANSGGYGSVNDDDVFGDSQGGSGGSWFTWFCAFIVQFLTILSFANAFYTFYRKRHYRLFESSVEVPLSTPSAQRVRIDSSPLASSPLRFLSNILAVSTAESRAHPDVTRDVWELAIWDPTPICLQFFTMFSPGHVLLYRLFFPISALDPRPSVTVVTSVALAALLSAQMSLLRSSFSQQIKDAAVIHKEVLHEYDTKFVHPNLTQQVREAGTQTPTTTSSQYKIAEVDTSHPFFIINRGFRPNPNPAYAAQYDPDSYLRSNDGDNAYQRPARSITTPALRTPGHNLINSATSTAFRGRASSAEWSSPIRQSEPQPPAGFRHFPPSERSAVRSGDGGSLGVFSHAASPLRKTASANFNPPAVDGRERRVDGYREKRSSMGTGLGQLEQLRGDRPVRSGKGRESGRY